MDSKLPFLSSLLTNLQRQPSDVAAEPQAGVIPYAGVQDQVSYLLITSRGTGKWIFPKGAVPSGVDPRHIAAAEAREEAGIIGLVEDHWLGSYRDTKKRENGEKFRSKSLFSPCVSRSNLRAGKKSANVIAIG